MKSKQYLKEIGKSMSDLQAKYTENFEAAGDFEAIMAITQPGSEDHEEAKRELADYDEKILAALKRDYPPAKPKPKPKTSARKPATKAPLYPIEDARATEEHPLANLRSLDPTIATPPLYDAQGKRRIDDAALDALEAYIDILPQTKALYTTNSGSYKADRKKLHSQILKKEIEGNACVRREQPIAVLTGGLPGSGKSTYIKKNTDWLTNPKIFNIDADEVRANLPEYQGWNASQTHEETRDIVKALLQQVGKNGCAFDVIYDGTMNKKEKYKPLVDMLKKEGYRVFILFLVIDEKTAMQRALGRYQRSGRYVPRDIITEGAKRGLTAFNELKNEVDGYVLIDGATQEVIEQGGAQLPADRDYTTIGNIDKPDAKPASASTSTSPRFSWKKAEPIASLKPVVLHCQHYHVKLEEDTSIRLKGSKKESIDVVAIAGEHVIFDDKGHPVFVMCKDSFARKCTEPTSVDKHKQEKHRPEEAPKPASKPKAVAKPAAKPKAADKPKAVAKPAAKPKAVSKPAAKPKAASKPADKPKTRISPEEAIRREIRAIRAAQSKRPIDREELKEQYAALEAKKDNKTYAAYIEKLLDIGEKDGVQLTEAQVIKLALLIRPHVQSKAGALQDLFKTNKNVMSPTYNNLRRWIKAPGRYDIAGVDAKADEKPTVEAKASEGDLFKWLGL